MTSETLKEALVFADDRPTSTGDDLYQWSLDAEAMIRNLCDLAKELAQKVDDGKRLLREEMERANRYAEASKARVPLSDEQLSKALEDGGVCTQTHIGIANRVSWTTCGSIDPRKICRAIEAAHGIAQEKP